MPLLSICLHVLTNIEITARALRGVQGVPQVPSPDFSGGWAKILQIPRAIYIYKDEKLFKNGLI